MALRSRHTIAALLHFIPIIAIGGGCIFTVTTTVYWPALYDWPEIIGQSMKLSSAYVIMKLSSQESGYWQ